MKGRKKKCPKCGEEATSNRQKECNHCDYVFERKAQKSSNDKEQRQGATTRSNDKEQRQGATTRSNDKEQRQGATTRSNDKEQRPSMPAAKPARGDDGMIVMIDFSHYPKLYETLTTLSIAEFRNPEGQVMYLLNNALQQTRKTL